MHTLWFDSFNNSFNDFESRLITKGIRFEYEVDESVTYGDGVIFTFYSDDDLETASDIYLDM